MSNQPDQPQPYVPPGYNSPPVPPYVPPAPPVQQEPAPPQYSAPQYNAPQYSDQYNAPQYSDQYNAPQYSDQYNAPQYSDQYNAPQYSDQYSAPQFVAPTQYQGGPGYAVNYGPKGLSIASMIIGLVSVFLLGFFIIPQIVGVILGHMGLKRESPQGRGFAITGLVANYIALVGYGLLVGFWFAILIAASATSSYSY